MENKKQNIFKRIIKSPESRKQIAIALIMTLLISIAIVVIGYFMKKNTGTVMAILGVTVTCIALLWLIFRFGFASTSRHAMRNVTSSALNKKTEKRKMDKKHYIKRSNSPYELEENENKKNKHGIYLMLVLGIIFIITSICILYS